MTSSLGMGVEYDVVDATAVRFAESFRSGVPTLVLTSPWPESLFAFRPIWPALVERFRVVAIDLPGFGGSEGRDELRTPEAMGRFLLRFIEHRGLQRPHLVAPDIGTSAALFAAAAHPSLLSSVVVGSGGAAVPLQLGDLLKDWELDADLERRRVTDPARIVNETIDAIEGSVPAEVREDYVASYDGVRFADSMLYVRSYPDELPKLAARLGEIRTPVRIIAGRRDWAMPLINADFLHERLPRSSLSVVDAGHFVWEEAPFVYAALVVDWVERGWTGIGGG